MTTTTRGFREPSFFVLASLLDGPLHGYGIIKQAAELSAGDVRLAPGTLYGALDRLADAGLIASSGQETVAGRPRHYYRLTEVGRESLLLEARRLSIAAHAVLDRITVDLSGDSEAVLASSASAASSNGSASASAANGAAASMNGLVVEDPTSAEQDLTAQLAEVLNVSAAQPSTSSTDRFSSFAPQRA